MPDSHIDAWSIQFEYTGLKWLCFYVPAWCRISALKIKRESEFPGLPTRAMEL